MTYPKLAVNRGPIRAERLRVGRERGEWRARELFSSPKCVEQGRHADQLGGCMNDGSSCLCECHDQAGE